MTQPILSVQFSFIAQDNTWVGELSDLGPAGFIPVQITMTVAGVPLTFCQKERRRDSEGDLVSVSYYCPDNAQTLVLYND